MCLIVSGVVTSQEPSSHVQLYNLVLMYGASEIVFAGVLPSKYSAPKIWCLHLSRSRLHFLQIELTRNRSACYN